MERVDVKGHTIEPGAGSGGVEEQAWCMAPQAYCARDAADWRRVPFVKPIAVHTAVSSLAFVSQFMAPILRPALLASASASTTAAAAAAVAASP
eukprot:9170200-Pyramimonas_sp.AAC.1